MIQLDGSNLTIESRQVGTRCGVLSPSPAPTHSSRRNGISRESREGSYSPFSHLVGEGSGMREDNGSFNYGEKKTAIFYYIGVS